MKTNFVVQYENLEVDERSVINAIKELWSNQGKKLKDIKDLQIYIKPQERTIYYVINCEESGSLVL